MSKKWKILVVLSHFFGVPCCLFFWLFSCPWVDRIYCDNYFMTKIETKCRRRGISFFSVSDPNASATPQVESTRSRRGCASSNKCKSNAPSRPHAHFDSFSIILKSSFVVGGCWREKKGRWKLPQVCVD